MVETNSEGIATFETEHHIHSSGWKATKVEYQPFHQVCSVTFTKGHEVETVIVFLKHKILSQLRLVTMLGHEAISLIEHIWHMIVGQVDKYEA